jgi:hypothetical protein
MAPKDGDLSFDEEDLVREGGVFVSRHSNGHEVGAQPDERTPEEDWVEDPYSSDGVPGTSDDLPYDYGVESAQPADQQVLSPDRRIAGFGHMGETGGADADVDEQPLGKPEERELWKRQRALMQESADEETHFPDASDAAVRQMEDAVGEDAAEPMTEGPEGTSATGSTGSGE